MGGGIDLLQDDAQAVPRLFGRKSGVNAAVPQQVQALREGHMGIAAYEIVQFIAPRLGLQSGSHGQ
ncbi:hypothetical protein D3C81_2197650 [compost metagenome]